MKRPWAYLLICCMGLLYQGLFAQASPHLFPVNAVIGDSSFLWKFHRLPTTEDPEALRIATHLEYVQHLLESKPASPPRTQTLRLLDVYRKAGQFPHNYDHPGRRPCFIDREGNICAVGYLIEQTAGRELAEKINLEYQYASVFEMEMPELTEWVGNSGLTLQECAMIQPVAFGYVLATNSNGERIGGVYIDEDGNYELKLEGNPGPVNISIRSPLYHQKMVIEDIPWNDQTLDIRLHKTAMDEDWDVFLQHIIVPNEY